MANGCPFEQCISRMYTKQYPKMYCHSLYCNNCYIPSQS